MCDDGYQEFIKSGCENIATFLLHKEMMDHCDEIVAIALAERMGGPNGYNLLLSAVKSSLPFSFLNGASSYAAFCTELLQEHYKCGKFYQNMKKSLYSTPFKSSSANFALDTQCKMDHKDVIKSFRTGATISSVLPRMSLIDSLNEAHASRVTSELNPEPEEPCSHLGWKITSKDIPFIIRTTSLILSKMPYSMIFQ